MTTERHKLLARSWTAVAEKYDQELVPRFAPYTQRLLSLLLKKPLPPGPVLVPACGPGHELILLGKALPDRQLLGNDLSAGMINVADRKLTAAGLRQRSELAVADASHVPDAWQPVAGLLSCFSLQQMAQPGAVLAAWAAALAPGGVLAVAYWPPAAAQPDAHWRDVTDPASLARASARASAAPALAAAPAARGPTAQGSGVPSSAVGGEAVSTSPRQPRAGDGASAAAASSPVPPAPPPPWDANEPAAAAAAAGAEVLADEAPAFDMRFRTAGDFFDVLMHAGPLQARLQALGPEHMAELRRAFVSSCADPAAPLTVRPAARLIVLRRRAAAL